jgi:prepilin-type N-terminal cleavage/methylation domain-containing protein
MQRRQGFTLVELLVAMALIVFIMAILSYAFEAATRSFRDLKAAGDLAEKLRSVSGQLRRELAADHFEGKKRLSDPTFWASGPPRQGFFRIYQGSRPGAAGALCILEGADQDGLKSYRTADHILHFTVKLRGNQESEFFSAGVPAGSPLLTNIFGPLEARYQGTGAYRYQWAEVAYFLRPSLDAQNQQDTANGTPLYSLYRRQRLAVPDNVLVTPPVQAADAANYLEVSCDPDPANTNSLYFNSPLDLTVPARRFGTDATGLPNKNVANYGLSYPTLADQAPVGSNLRGADLVLTDVVSFDVRVLLGKKTSGTTVIYGGPPDPLNPFIDLYDASLGVYDNGNTTLFAANGPRVFDTWSSAYSGVAAVPDYSTWDAPNPASAATKVPMWKADAANNNLRGPMIQAIQVTIRVWDAKTSLTRQITIVQAM